MTGLLARGLRPTGRDASTQLLVDPHMPRAHESESESSSPLCAGQVESAETDARVIIGESGKVPEAHIRIFGRANDPGAGSSPRSRHCP